ncbi:MAG: hypothetical protein RIS94_2531 [Pseudomonadota bacterium]|jgi:phage shock protein C
MTDLRFDDSAVRPLSRSTGGFRLDKARGKVFGVCAGIADYFDVDVTLVRIAWVAGTLLGFGSLLLIYLIVALVAD